MLGRQFPSLGHIVLNASAASGPFASAAAQFALTAVLLRDLSTSSFGGFAFLMIVTQFNLSAWNALFCAPLPLLFNRAIGESDFEPLKATASVGLIAGLAGSSTLAALASLLEAPLGAALLLAGHNLVAMARGFARSYAFVRAEPMRVVQSDIIYSASLFVMSGLILMSGSASLQASFAALLVSTGLGLLPFGRREMTHAAFKISLSGVRKFGNIWQEHASWSLLGVLTTEAIANSHAYLIVMWKGPAVFAPVAATALLLRPLSVLTNALSERARPAMARSIATRDFAGANLEANQLRSTLLLACAGTGATATLVVLLAPTLLFPDPYGQANLLIGALLWTMVGICRCFRAPESALLQAAGAFRSLATASAGSCTVSIVACTLLLVFADPVWSIFGLVVGQVAFSVLVSRHSRAIRCAWEH